LLNAPRVQIAQHAKQIVRSLRSAVRLDTPQDTGTGDANRTFG
jgi:hypothetical protein